MKLTLMSSRAACSQLLKVMTRYASMNSETMPNAATMRTGAR